MSEIQHNPEQPKSLPVEYKPMHEIQHLLENIGMKAYLSKLSECEVVPCNPKTIKPRIYHITKIVYEKEVFFPDKLSMVYSALHNEADTVFLVVQRTESGQIDFYIGARDKDLVGGCNHHNSGLQLKSATMGCFPGIVFEGKDNEPVPKDKLLLNKYKEKFALASVSAIGSLKSEDKKTFIQGVEKLIDSASDSGSFSAIFIADSVSSEDLASIRKAYEEIYSNLVPMSEMQYTYSQSSAQTVSDGVTRSISKSISKSVTKTVSNGTSTSKSENWNLILIGGGESSADSHTDTYADTKGDATTKVDGRTKNRSNSETEGRNHQIKLENKSVKEMMGRIDKQIKRLGKGESFGMWNFAAYFVAPNATTAIKLADAYKGIISGKETGLETAAVNIWRNEDKKERDRIYKHVRNFEHPVLRLPENNITVTPGVMVSTEELAVNMSFPQKSISGVIVKEQASFGRNVPKPKHTEKGIDLGCIEHLSRLEESNRVFLDIESLSKHTFITGTTGSGKSNTIYHILNDLTAKRIPFLVIEPAKGEYKNVFSDKVREGRVRVFGTNPLKMPLLRINPFSFPEKDTHVLEHIDRIVEIFNVCWPMYAAMPAVLKASIEAAYKSCGWDLMKSKNEYIVFPTFEDVLFELKDIINNSEYSADTQGDYKGALETRLRSLTNGILGQMFVADEILDEELFSSSTSTIIDLSRVGSSETKSMIMGLLIMKLNEYRMSEAKGINLELRHVTVLEEAHNLLKRTSKEQSSESANITGKSVEMIANSIAEMRTYGEGFIIADQSPSMLDEAAVRNTNTKIIMALPDKNDREFAGKSIGLKEQQIEEITMLPTGRGVVYQNSWQEAVLCKIEKCEPTSKKFEYDLSEIEDSKVRLFKRLIDIYQSEGAEFKTVDEMKKELRESAVQGTVLYRLFSDFDEDIVEDTDGKQYVGEEDAAKVFALVVGLTPMIEVQNIEDIKEYNRELLLLLKNKLSKEQQALFRADELLLDMYVRGCEQCSDDMFYSDWKKLSYGN